MGSASSIECTPYDETKFLKSKAIMESAADDAEKFAKLKSIWVDGDPCATDTYKTQSVFDDAVKADEAHKDGAHNSEHCGPKDGENVVHEDSEHYHKEDELHRPDGETHHTEEHQSEKSDHKTEELHVHNDEDCSDKDHAHVQKDDPSTGGSTELSKPNSVAHAAE